MNYEYNEEFGTEEKERQYKKLEKYNVILEKTSEDFPITIKDASVLLDYSSIKCSLDGENKT